MKWRRFLLIVVVLPLLAVPASAGFFSKRSKQNASDKVSNLIGVLRGERSEGKREDAIQDLRQYDAGQYPEIVNSLIERVQNDPSADVRKEAIKSLSEMQPFTQQMGWALQQAQSNDSSYWVRREAKRVLAHVRPDGARDPRTGEAANVLKPEDPPLPQLQGSSPQMPMTLSPGFNSAPRMIPQPTGPSAPVTSPEPVSSAPFTATSIPRPLPPGPPLPPVNPEETPMLVPPPSSSATPVPVGPELIPPY